MSYGIKHRVTGLFFAGFDASNAPVWADESKARAMSREAAHSQALLFRCFDIAAQIKPVVL